MMQVDTSSRSEQRDFGLVMADALVAVALVHCAIRGHLAAWMIYLADAFFLLGLLAPLLLRPIFAVWMKFAVGVNWLMTRVLLSIVFFGLITPMSLWFRLRRVDPLDRAWKPDADTYWEEAEEQPDDPRRYFRQY